MAGLAAIDALATITAGRRTPLLVDVRESGAQERAARVEFTQRGDMVSAVALIVGTPLSRAMGNFFLAVSRPMAPTKLFDDEDEAAVWLRTYLS
jgi:hypothetical protein